MTLCYVTVGRHNNSGQISRVSRDTHTRGVAACAWEHATDNEESERIIGCMRCKAYVRLTCLQEHESAAAESATTTNHPGYCC